MKILAEISMKVTMFHAPSAPISIWNAVNCHTAQSSKKIVYDDSIKYARRALWDGINTRHPTAD